MDTSHSGFCLHNFTDYNNNFMMFYDLLKRWNINDNSLCRMPKKY